MSILIIDDKIIDTRDIVEIEEKNITFSIRHEKPNPEPKPKGFLAKLMYSDTIEYYEKETHFCLVLKVKGGVQMRGRVSEDGSVSTRSNQLYDFYTICNNSRLIELVKMDIRNGSKEKVLEIGNYLIYFDTLCYPDYIKTNTLVDKSIKSKRDFIDKYMS